VTRKDRKNLKKSIISQTTGVLVYIFCAYGVRCECLVEAEIHSFLGSNHIHHQVLVWFFGGYQKRLISGDISSRTR